MAIKAEQLKAELIDRVAARLRKRLESERAEVAELFLRQFYARVPPDDILGVSPDNLYGAALALLNHGRKRQPGTCKTRVYNPRPEEQGWKSSHTIVEIINDDMPFLVDSVTAELNRLGVEVYLMIHPIIRVERDDRGQFVSLREAGDARDGAAGESFMHAQISEQPSERHKEIRQGLDRVLADVRAAVEDWSAMRKRLRDIVAQLKQSPPALPKEEIAEGVAFLEWIDNDQFTYLGSREYNFEGEGEAALARVLPESGLGVLRDEQVSVFDGLRNLGSLPAEVQDFLKQPELLRCSKSHRHAAVHRRVHMDAIAVKRFDAEGRVAGERLFLGLFTSVAYSRSPRYIPLLRQKIGNVAKRAGFQPHSHDGKALMHILETYPRDELFQISEDELLESSMGILHLQERQRIALFSRQDPFQRFVSCLVYVPRDRYDTALRLKFQDILAEAYRGEVDTYATHLGDAALARLHVIIKTARGEIPEVDLHGIERKLVEAGRSWADRLEQALIEDRGEEQGLRILRRYAKAFPASYQEHFNTQTAVFDIARAEEAIDSGQVAMNLYRPLEAGEDEVRFKTFIAGEPVPLSDVLPMLEKMGLKVISETPYDLRPAGRERPVWMHDFAMRTEDGLGIDLGQVKDAFHETFALVWRAEMDNDGFNKLVLRAGLCAREVQILRAYCKYLRQARIPFSQEYMEQTLARNPMIARRLVDLFLARFASGEGVAAGERATALVGEIEAALEEVANLDEDRIIRRFLNCIESTLRTNFAQKGSDGGPKPYLSFKIESRNIDELPLPRPFREIFVYSPRVEGVHLRFGMVARGGLRWSDRREDFRTEILGLAKAQQVKNAVIVPVGSKGGFVVKRAPPHEAGREAFLEEGIACYKTFVSGLLDLTDNLKGGKLVPPADVVRRDGEDPYLVVAADKGTATFSDIANEVSASYGFWLDDAFASGGSAGYDHKAMGITARGVWESVKRHFRELGKDIQSEDFTVMGVGDMSGDVFGNGILLSKHIKLIGAFNHLHIFIDPNPNPAKSWAERKRLFELPRSAWTDYAKKLISKGGGIFDRKAKSIDLSPQMKKLFELTADRMTPNELISAMLKAKVELLWFGGIGTYVKSSHETHLDAGDRANDALRVDGTELRCQVIGEGANLGMTQQARVEYALAGGCLNTDSIDNSAGVDCSDHEVNIKILLRDLEVAGDMTRKQRNELLERMTDEVAELVLRDNYLQTQSITVSSTIGAHLLDRMARYMRALEKAGHLDRAVEFLPDDETIAERFAKGIGMTRPELSVLTSYAKITLYEELLSSDLPDDPYMSRELIGYFPGPLRQEAYAEQIAGHHLHREIIATVVTNELVNRVGVTFVHEAREKSAMSSADIARAYTVSREIFAMDDLFAKIEALDNKILAPLQAAMLVECGRLIERGTVWFLRLGPHPLDIRAQVKSYGAGVADLAENLQDLLSDADRKLLFECAAGYHAQGAPEALALSAARLAFLVPACDIVRIAQGAGLEVLEVGRAYFAIGARFGFDWLRRAAGHLPSDSAWDKLAVTAIIDDLYGNQGELASRIVDGLKDLSAGDGAIDNWAERRRPLVVRSEQLLAELQSFGAPDLAMLAVANRQLRSMVSD